MLHDTRADYAIPKCTTDTFLASPCGKSHVLKAWHVAKPGFHMRGTLTLPLDGKNGKVSLVTYCDERKLCLLNILSKRI